ncbi:MAG: CFI-box-CTERM domain-containing protein, partial [Nitrosopumilus sp.]
MKLIFIIPLAVIAIVGVMVPNVFAQQFDDFDYSIRGGEVLNFELDSEETTLFISIDARARGELIITLPRAIIDAKIGSEDTDFEVFIRGMQLSSYEETITPFDRTVTIPFKRSNDEFAIVGTHMFSQPAVTIQTNSIEQTIESELNESTPDGQAKLLIFSDTEWAGAYQSSNIEVMEISGQNDDDILFECNSSLGRQALFGAKIQKLTQDGYLELYVIQNQKIISQGFTEASFGEVYITDSCLSNSAPTPPGGGCLIATATYGSELAPQVQQLRELRDNQLLQTESGVAFMSTFNDIYYSFSPTIADYERENPYFKEIVKLAITPMISTLSLMENAESESEVLGIGISVIMLNLGMYLGIPAV